MEEPGDPPVAFDLGDQPSVLFEHLSPVGVEYLTAEGEIPRARLEIAHSTARQALDGVDALCRLVFTLELKGSVDLRAGTDNYSLERGNNIVNARAMALPDGSYDIITGAEWLVELDDSPADVADLRTRMLIHTMAHEAQHVRLMDMMTEAENYGDDVNVAPSEASAVHGMAILIDEYRCEVTANRFARTGSRAEDLDDHLVFFRKEMTASFIEQQRDLAAGARRAAVACHEVWKTIAYLAAERADDTDEVALEPPQPAPADWDDYLAAFWPVMIQIFRLVPGADEEADEYVIVAALELLCQAFTSWMGSIGFQLQVDDDGTVSAYWLRETY